MEDGVSERKHDKNEKNDEEQEAEYPHSTPHDHMEEGVSEKKDYRNEKKMRKKRQNGQM